MKKIISILVLLSLVGFSFAQEVPQFISYQGIARNFEGEILSEKSIILEISIYKSDNLSVIEYQESQNPTTDKFGTFNIEIGNGTPTFAGLHNEFSELEWSENKYSIRIRIDLASSETITGLLDLGTKKILSQPYSFVSKYAYVADSLSAPYNISLAELSDIQIDSPSDLDVLTWDATLQKWIAADPSGETDAFLRADGTIDLSADWTILNNNITLQNGTFTANNLKLNTGITANEISDDETMSGNSSTAIPTERAVKTYLDDLLSGASGIWVSNSNYVYITSSQNVGIGTNTPSHKFQVNLNSDEGILFQGSFGNTVPDLGAGTRMSFYPAKAAFRAGRIENNTDFWDNINVGNYSTAFGYDTKAKGDYSFSTGRNNSSTASYSVSFGRDNTSAGLYSTTLGRENNTSGQNSFANGNKSNAIGDNSTALGYSTTARTYCEFAIGRYTHSIGTSAGTWQSSNALFLVGNGSNTSTSNAFVILKNGNVGIGIGQNSPNYLLEVGKSGDGSEARANAWNTFSDKNLKKDFKKIDEPIEKLMQINGYYYHWKNAKDTSWQVGVIAQEVEKILPEIVSTDKKGIKSLDYSKITPLLIEVAKKQQKEIENLKSKNSNIQKSNSELENKIKNLEIEISEIQKYIKANANANINK